MCFPLPDLRLSIKELRRLKYVFHYLIQFRAFCQLVCFQIFFASLEILNLKLHAEDIILYIRTIF